MDEIKICKTKGCNNPALDGKYCDYCTQVRKEQKSTAAKVAGGAAIPVAGAVIKTGVWKKVPELAIKAIRLVLRK